MMRRICLRVKMATAIPNEDLRQFCDNELERGFFLVRESPIMTTATDLAVGDPFFFARLFAAKYTNTPPRHPFLIRVT